MSTNEQPDQISIWREADDLVILHIPGYPVAHDIRLTEESIERLFNDLTAARRVTPPAETATAETDAFFAGCSTPGNPKRWLVVARYPERRLAAAQATADRLTKEVERVTAECAALRQGIQLILDSAKPHPVEHPKMATAWKLGEAALAITSGQALLDELKRLREDGELIEWANQEWLTITWNPLHDAFIVQRTDQVCGNIGRGKTVIEAIRSAKGVQG